MDLPVYGRVPTTEPIQENAFSGDDPGVDPFLTDFENTVTEMQISTNETMQDSDLVGFLTTAISMYEPFSSIKASLDTNALMNKQEITYDGMLHVYTTITQRSRI